MIQKIEWYELKIKELEGRFESRRLQLLDAIRRIEMLEQRVRTLEVDILEHRVWALEQITELKEEARIPRYSRGSLPRTLGSGDKKRGRGEQHD